MVNQKQIQDENNNSFSDPKYLPKASEKIEVNGKMYSFKYCDTCNIYRPPRSSHCRNCDNCVEKWDHHW